MQTISGIHYNFSLPEAPGNDAYFALIRNFRRHSWLLLYLFGASPAVCASFVEGRTHELLRLSEDTFYLPHATSLRMGRLGYQSDAQSALAVSYNSLDSYGASLQDALTRPYPPYEAIGVRDGDEYRQLSTTLLQIENEFYGTIRPKRRISPGERPLHALRERGVEYVEVRLMDLDPVRAGRHHAGDTMRFLDVFLLHCLLRDSPPDTPQEIAAIGRNQLAVASRGREPGLVARARRRRHRARGLGARDPGANACRSRTRSTRPTQRRRTARCSPKRPRGSPTPPPRRPRGCWKPWLGRTAIRTRASRSRNPYSIETRSWRCRSRRSSIKSSRRWPRARARSSARSKSAIRCRSSSIASATSTLPA